MLFRKPRDEFKRYASHVQGLHGLLRPAQVDQDDDEDKVDDHGQNGHGHDHDDHGLQGLRRRGPTASYKILLLHLWKRIHIYSRSSF